jgi:hypothetical protein
MASRGNQPPASSIKDDRELQRRGEELVKLIERARPVKPAAARGPAPKWAHALLDLLWDLLFGNP